MEIKLLGEKRALLIKIDSELDHHVAGKIRETADSKIKSTNAINVIFDFSDVGFMDSSGIGMIMGRYKTVKTLGGKVVIFGQNLQMQRIIDMSGINKLVKVAKTLNEALMLI